jgi:putative MATE family efflux protein
MKAMPIKSIDTDLTTGDIKKHIKQIAIPASIGFLFNTLFNVVDTIFAGRLSTEALAGLTISFPVFFVIIALSAGIGNGVTSLISIALGKKDKSTFHALGFNALVIGLFFGVVLIFTAPLFTEPLFRLAGSTGASLSEGLTYTNTIFYGAIFFLISAILNGILSAQGDTKSYRNFLVIGFFMNLILDPMLIFGWFGLPRLGVMGIALATIIVQAVGVIYLGYRVFKSPEFIPKSFIKQRIDIGQMIALLKQGIPATLNMATIAIGIFIINYYVLLYGGDAGIAGYGAAVRIEQLALLPALGLNIAALTITGQNFGANQMDRIYDVRKKTLLYGTIIMVVGAFLIYPLAPYLVGIFNPEDEVIRIGTQYLRIEVLAFVTYVILNIYISVLQGIKKPNFAIFMGLYRQLLPFVLFRFLGTTLQMGLLGVWWGIVIINWSAVLITVIYTNIVLDKTKKEFQKSS